MVKKDWKINKQGDKNTFSWHNEDIEEFVWVYLQDYSEESYGYKKKSEWFFEVHKHNTTILEKATKTKSQAMAWAEKYMRGH